MTTQESTLDSEGINLYFIIPSKYNDDTECSDDMWLAYNKCEEFDINPTWITEKECQKIRPDKRDVFVIEEFQGELFESLKSYKCSIVGPRCLLFCCMNNEPIPAGQNPVFLTAMRDLVICASGFSQEVKARIQEKVEYMGGIFSRQLVGSVTHLITDRIMSQKYDHAVKLKIKVMSIDWINAVWEENLTRFVKATDPIYDKYKCSVFMNAVVTATDLTKAMRQEISTLITTNGGEYMGKLDGSKTNILLASENSTLTEKLKFALNKNIPCLKYQWVKESIEAGYALPFDDYLIKSTKASSTPEKSAATLNFSSVSMIPFENHNETVDESLAMTMSSMRSNRINSLSSTSVASTAASTSDVPFFMSFLDNTSLATVKKLGPFLDGCNIYITGLPSKYRDKLNKIINVSSATRLDEITDSITHILVGDKKKAKQEIKVIYSKGLRPHIVDLKWLEKSMKLKHPAPENDFLIETESMPSKDLEPPSPLSKKNLEMLHRPQKPIPPLFNDQNEKIIEAPHEPDLVQEYLSQNNVENKSMAEVFRFGESETTLKENKKKEAVSMKEISTCTNDASSFRLRTCGSESLVPLSQDEMRIERVFKGLTFLLTGFDAKEFKILMERIEAMGGRIVSRSYAGIPDYAVVPISGATLKTTVDEIITEFFIDDCFDKNVLVPLEYYHRPVLLKGDAQPLRNCVIAISTYSGQERSYLQYMAEVLGALHQDTFARKTNVDKRTYASTHLICPVPEGQKYNAAVKWKLPAVTAEWLIECAKKLELVDETPYLVGETMAPERPNIELMKAPLKTPLRNKNIQQDSPAMQTPIINKRLSSLMNIKSPKSPFHISTPETPYGIMFKDNPSPETRKNWIKWINNFPDLREHEPPPPKRRAPSTPLSELKKQMWEKMKGPLEGDEDADVSRNEIVDGNEEFPVFNDEKNLTNRKLAYSNENTPSKSNHIELQIDKLEKALRASTTSAEKKHSLSGENARKYQLEPETDKCMEKDTQQPFTVSWEYPGPQKENNQDEKEGELERRMSPVGITKEVAYENTLSSEESQSKRKFMLSGIKGKAFYEESIQKLGGSVSMESNFDPTATHLLCNKPGRNEKILCSIASGKWILHISYIDECGNAKEFLDEEKYEWGNPSSKNSIPDPESEQEKSLAAAAYRWRTKLSREPSGAFVGMIALLIVPEDKHDSFKRLILAGKGSVVQSRSSHDSSYSGKNITHCFIQQKQKFTDWARMASEGILCFHPQFLHELLTTEGTIDQRKSVLPEFKKYLALLPK